MRKLAFSLHFHQKNYITYKTFYQVNKAIQDDPTLETKKAKRQIARTAELHDTNIAQRVEVIVEHFRTTVMQELDGNAKAMVITDSRQGAVKYRQAMDEYLNKKGYSDIKALVAFSGKVKVDDVEYSEAKMNGFSEDKLPEKFDKDGYQVLLVANKYQTGFDQKKLCAMYILKKLRGVNAVQTLSRLNRICAPYKKQTFILDFKNDYEDMKAAFAPYYTSTFLANSVNPRNIYELEKKIDAYGIIDYDDVMKFNEWMYKGLMDKKQVVQLLANHKEGMTRSEIGKQVHFDGKMLTVVLKNLERCDFVLRYSQLGNKVKDAIYRLSDFYTLFYFKYVQANNSLDEQWWSKHFNSHSVESWQGQTFELVCMTHVDAIKQKLGIAGIATDVSAWRYVPKNDSEKGAQIDMVISRADRAINLCEMKFALGKYQVSADYADYIRDRAELFRTKTKTKYAVVPTMVTTYGVAEGANSSVAQQEITMEDLFRGNTL